MAGEGQGERASLTRSVRRGVGRVRVGDTGQLEAGMSRPGPTKGMHCDLLRILGLVIRKEEKEEEAETEI